MFTGIGGIDLAAEWAGFRTIAQVERDPYCIKILEKHWPGVHRCREIRDFPDEKFWQIVADTEHHGCDSTKENATEQGGNRENHGVFIRGSIENKTIANQDREHGAVTLVSGGFPCQPFSAAGKRRGKEDDRYLWPEMRRVIAEIKPTWVVAENVAGLASMAQFNSLPKLEPSADDRYRIGDVYRRTGPGILKIILEEIESLGYEVTPIVVPAAGAGAPHYRYRVFIVGNSASTGWSAENCRFSDAEWQTLQSTDWVGFRNESDAASEDVEYSQGQRGREEPDQGSIVGASQDVADTEIRQNNERKRRSLEKATASEKSGNTTINLGGKNATDSASGSKQSSGTQCDVGEFQDEIMRKIGNADHGAIECRLGRTTDGFSPWFYRDWEQGVPRVIKGQKHRVDRLRCLGNAVVPQQVYPILQAIAEVEKMKLGGDIGAAD